MRTRRKRKTKPDDPCGAHRWIPQEDVVRQQLCVVLMALAAGLSPGFPAVSPVEAQAPPATPATTWGGCPAEVAAFHPCALDKIKTFTPPRTIDGRPDLQGIWRRPVGSSIWDIEEHPNYGPRDWPAGKSLIVDPPDGRIPYQPWAAALGRRNGEHYKKYIDPNGRCFQAGVPRDMLISPVGQLVQPAGQPYILWHIEEAHAYRIIFMDGRLPLGSDVKLWQGHSVGRWEGNTLVVTTTNLNGKTWFDLAGNFASDAARVVERRTLIDANTIHYQATIDDPKVFTRPWTMAYPHLREMTKDFRILEEACHEGDRDWEHIRSQGYRMFPGVTPPNR